MSSTRKNPRSSSEPRAALNSVSGPEAMISSSSSASAQDVGFEADLILGTARVGDGDPGFLSLRAGDLKDAQVLPAAGGERARSR